MLKTKKKIVVVLSGINKSVYFEHFLSRLSKEEYEIYVILLNSGDSFIEQFLLDQGIFYKRLRYASKFHSVFVTIRLILEFIKFRPCIVHAHLFDAGLTSMLAARLAFIRKRVYTRHHSDLHHVYHSHAVKYDKFINFLATDVIAVSEIVKEILLTMEYCHERKVHVVPNAFDFSLMTATSVDRKQALIEKYSIPIDKFRIGVISRFVDWKGVIYILEAFTEVIKKGADSYLILANAKGPMEEEVVRRLKELPDDSYCLIDFEPDNYALISNFDVFVHTPVSKFSESFGQVYIEALALKVPMVATLSGIAGEILVNEENCLVVPFRNSKAIYEAIMKLKSDDFLIQKLKSAELPLNLQSFHFSNHMKRILHIYSS